jgi:O-methyltransferase involved in polyketide biosynthesis
MTYDPSDERGLKEVPQTLLWTLHNRASEAQRPAGILRDPEAVRIRDSMRFDFEAAFGPPDGSHALRSRLFDDALKPWLSEHPDATVVELGCGLETQQRRCDNGRVQWLCVDLPEALAVRERYLPPGPRCQHLGLSALDLRWVDSVAADGPVFITAQGLLMYFEPSQVEDLLRGIGQRLPKAELMFDVIPPWFSRKTLRGLKRTANYVAPPMPWGLHANDVAATLARWLPGSHLLRIQPFGPARGVAGALTLVMGRLPGLRTLLPCTVHVSGEAGRLAA